MRGALAKEQRRNLKNAIGDTAAAAVANLAGEHATLQLQHRTLATQMHEFERTIATLRECRAQDLRFIHALDDARREDLKTIAALRDDLNLAHEKLGDARTEERQYRVDLRAYVDRRFAALRPWHQRLRDWWKNRQLGWR